MIDKDLFSGKRPLESLRDNELDNLWHTVFNDSKLFAVLFYINPMELLKRLKTPEGREELLELLPEKTRKELYDEALKIGRWQERESNREAIEKVL